MKLKIVLPYFLFLVSGHLSACKKKAHENPAPPTPPSQDTTVVTPKDPETAGTIGFFMNEWRPVTFTAPEFTEGAVSSSANVMVDVDASTIVTKIPRTLFGNNANLWMGQFVTEPALMNHISNLHPKIIRFPGGSISDVFFWNAGNRQKLIDAPDSL